MPSTKLTPVGRRALVLRALSGESVAKLAKEYGVARSWAYVLLEDAKTDSKTKTAEAYEEWQFRRKVEELAGCN